MPRKLRKPKRRDEIDLVDAEMDLLVGPHPPKSKADEFRYRQRIAELEEAWWRFRDAVLAECPPGTRPWAFWVVERSEKPPGGPIEQAVRLAELGGLQPAEIARLRSDGQGFGQMDRQIWKAVAAVLERTSATKGRR